MSTLNLLTLAQSEAVVEILLLLFIAAIIGYITAWLFFKSIYNRKYRAFEAEKDELNKHITDLKADNRELFKKLREQSNETDSLQKETNTLKTLNEKAVHESDELKLKNERTEKKLLEKDEALIHIAQRKHLLDYKSFGSAKEAEKDDLSMISGIGPFIEERLHALDIYTFRQISKLTARDIESINVAIEYFAGRIERDEWVAQARELAIEENKRMELLDRIRARKTQVYFERIGIARKDEADDLTIISGIGGWINQKLNALDIYTFRQISNFNEKDVQTITEIIEYFPGRIDRDEWIYQSQELVRIAGNKAGLLKRIRERKDKIYFDRLGTAHKHHANNLTLINGIGLWIEERLNMLDLYTFEQISNITDEDVKTISEILEISPERIKRDKWVNQARILAKKFSTSLA